MKIGLALSGGGLRGFAHIGVLEVLQEEGIEPDVIAGTSSGAVVGALYARGMSPQRMRQLIGSFPGARLIDWSMPMRQWIKWLLILPLHSLGLIKNPTRLLPPGLISGDRLEQYLRRLFRLTPVHKPKPLYVIATDLFTAETVIFTNQNVSVHAPRRSPSPYALPRNVTLPIEDLAATVRASASIPGIFSPRQINGRILIDGGQRNNIPVDLLYSIGCHKVIAVDLSRSSMSEEMLLNFVDIIHRALDIMLEDISALRLSPYHFFPIIPEIHGVGLTSFQRIDYCLEMGRLAAQAALPALRRYLQSPCNRLS